MVNQNKPASPQGRRRRYIQTIQTTHRPCGNFLFQNNLYLQRVEDPISTYQEKGKVQCQPYVIQICRWHQQWRHKTTDRCVVLDIQANVLVLYCSMKCRSDEETAQSKWRKETKVFRLDKEGIFNLLYILSIICWWQLQSDKIVLPWQLLYVTYLVS